MSLNIKYLYGKMSALGQVLHPNGGFQFKDLYSFKKEHDKNHGDNEGVREFIVPAEDLEFVKIGEVKILSQYLKQQLKIGAPVQRCHILCLSQSEFSEALFKWFNADICLKVNVTKLLEILSDTLNRGVLEAGGKLQIISKPIQYYKTLPELEEVTSEKLIFWKSSAFAIENEYRIAVVWPYGENTHLRIGRNNIRIWDIDDSLFRLAYLEPKGIRQVVIEGRTRDGRIFYRDGNPIKS